MKGDMSDEAWEQQQHAFHETAYSYVYSLGGRISGEHGIGAKKVYAMEKYTDPVELAMMKAHRPRGAGDDESHKKSPGSAGYPESGQSDECILISVAIVIIAGTGNCKTVLPLLKQRSSE